MQCAQQSPLGDGIEAGSGLVENQDRRVAEQEAGDGEPAPLAAGKLQALLTDPGVPSFRQTANSGQELGFPGGRIELPLVGFRVGEKEVFAHGAGEEIGALREHADDPPEILEPVVG